MESLLNKPVYNYKIIEKSQINYQGRTNCCFISSFYIQMKKHFDDFPNFNTILNLLYSQQTNAYTHFAFDFPSKWFKLKDYLINQDKIWESRLSNIILQICVPLINQSQCVLLSYINLNMIIPEEINLGNYESLEKSFSDVEPSNSKVISIIQLLDHFEPITIINHVGTLQDEKLIKNPDFLI
jgi:hypothetical protein